MGERDYVPDALRAAGFRVQIHRIAIRPGKPFLFATRGRGAAAQVAFGLPGNPFSVLVTAWEFLLPFLRSSGGGRDPGPRVEFCRAAEAIERAPGLTHFVPVRIDRSGSEMFAHTVRYHGSGDYVAMSRADGVAVLSAERPTVVAGDPVPVHVFGAEPVLRGLARTAPTDVPEGR
jgi:molybdopterin molybdotransferase